MATKLRLLGLRGQSSATAQVPVSTITITAPVPTASGGTSPGTKLRLVGLRGQTHPVGATKLRLLKVRGTATAAASATRLRLVGLRGTATPTVTAVAATVTPSTASVEPGDAIMLTAAGTVGAVFTWALLSGSWPATLTPATIGGPQCTVTPALNVSVDGLPQTVRGQVVASLPGLPDSTAQFTLTVYAVATFVLADGPSWQPALTYRL